MASSIPIALLDAGFQLPPQTKRIWQWLHDHRAAGGFTAKQISGALKIAIDSVSAQLPQMLRRGMLVRAEERRQGKMLLCWTTAPGMHEYELLPVNKALATAKKAPAPDLRIVPAQAAPAPGKIVVVQQHDPLDSMNVNDAYALYLRLDEMFKRGPV